MDETVIGAAQDAVGRQVDVLITEGTATLAVDVGCMPKMKEAIELFPEK